MDHRLGRGNQQAITRINGTCSPSTPSQSHARCLVRVWSNTSLYPLQPSPRTRAVKLAVLDLQRLELVPCQVQSAVHGLDAGGIRLLDARLHHPLTLTLLQRSLRLRHRDYQWRNRSAKRARTRGRLHSQTSHAFCPQGHVTDNTARQTSDETAGRCTSGQSQIRQRTNGRH